jgi:hypothetical protein
MSYQDDQAAAWAQWEEKLFKRLSDKLSARFADQRFFARYSQKIAPIIHQFVGDTVAPITRELKGLRGRLDALEGGRTYVAAAGDERLVEELRDTYREISQSLFGSSLPDIQIRLHDADGQLGKFNPATPHISLHRILAAYGDRLHLASTLAHECAHFCCWRNGIACDGEHGPHHDEWRSEMGRIGLHHHTHAMLTNGLFEQWWRRRSTTPAPAYAEESESR